MKYLFFIFAVIFVVSCPAGAYADDRRDEVMNKQAENLKKDFEMRERRRLSEMMWAHQIFLVSLENSVGLNADDLKRLWYIPAKEFGTKDGSVVIGWRLLPPLTVTET